MSITQKLWINITTNQLGLRAATSKTDLNGAAFGRDDAIEGMARIRNPPANRDEKLNTTLAWMINFAKSHGRTHLINSKAPGITRDCKGAFAKGHSARQGKVPDSGNFNGGVDARAIRVKAHI